MEQDFALLLIAEAPLEPIHMFWGSNEAQIFWTILEGANQASGGEWDPPDELLDISYCAKLADQIEAKLDDIDLLSQIDSVENLYGASVKLVDFLRNCNGFKVAHGVPL